MEPGGGDANAPPAPTPLVPIVLSTGSHSRDTPTLLETLAGIAGHLTDDDLLRLVQTAARMRARLR